MKRSIHWLLDHAFTLLAAFMALYIVFSPCPKKDCHARVADSKSIDKIDQEKDSQINDVAKLCKDALHAGSGGDAKKRQ
jgi:hypothetical protein